jgi:hypothetical protein
MSTPVKRSALGSEDQAHATVSPPHSPALVAASDAPLIGESEPRGQGPLARRRHTRLPSSPTTMRRLSTKAPQRAGASQTEGGDGRAGVKRESPALPHEPQRPRRTTRPGTRTLGPPSSPATVGRSSTSAPQRACAIANPIPSLANCNSKCDRNDRVSPWH